MVHSGAKSLPTCSSLEQELAQGWGKTVDHTSVNKVICQRVKSKMYEIGSSWQKFTLFYAI